MLTNAAIPSFFGGGSLSTIDENATNPIMGKSGGSMPFATPAKMQQQPSSLFTGGGDVPLKPGALDSASKPRRALGALSSSQINVRSLAPTPQKAASSAITKTPSAKSSFAISVDNAATTQVQTSKPEEEITLDSSFTDEDMICTRFAAPAKDPADIVAELAAGRTLKRKQQVRAAAKAGTKSSAFATTTASASKAKRSSSSGVSAAISELENSLLMSGILDASCDNDFIECNNAPMLSFNIDDLLADLDK